MRCIGAGILNDAGEPLAALSVVRYNSTDLQRKSTFVLQAR